MPCSVYENFQIVLADQTLERGVMIVRDGRIEYLGRSRPDGLTDAETTDGGGAILTPGFVDLHVHGGDDADFMDGTAMAVRTVLKAHARHGTTTLFPTTTTGSREQIMAMIGATAEAAGSWRPSHGARIAGVHLYGPYFAPDKVGCHRVEGRRDPTHEEYDAYFASRQIRIATCAAELPGAESFFKAAQQHGCLITCGHSNATWHEMEQAFQCGMRHVDHFWCAMSSVQSLRGRCGTPMQASMEQYVLANREMSTEVIADGHHLSDELLDFAYRMLGPKRLCLVTDSSRALDMPPGCYRFGPRDDGSLFLHDGQVGRTGDGGSLASSAAGMDHMVRTMLRATGAPLHDVIRMASLTPAERAGMAGDCGSLEVGKRADFILFSKHLRSPQVFIEGESVSVRPA